MKYKLLLITLFACGLGWGQVLMTTTGSYNQDFNSLPSTGTPTWTNNSTLENWYSSGFTSFIVGTGSGTGGGLYSFGVAGTNVVTERALGSLGSGSATPAYGVVLRNTSGVTITDIKISYTGEQWRNGGVVATQPLAFYYATSASPISSIAAGATGYTSVAALNFTSKVGTTTAAALDGNLAANRTTFSNIPIPSLSLPNDSYIILKWDDINDSGNDHGLAIDDVTISWSILQNTTYTTTWSNSAPTASIDAIIDGDLTTTTDLACKDLTINSGKTLTIGAGKKLTVAGNLINNGTIVFKSDANGTAMFDVFNGTQSGTGVVTVERFIPSGKRSFRLISSAVTTTTFISGNWQQGTHITGGAIGGFDATETNNPSMFTYDNLVATGSGWTPIANTNATNLTAGVGYRVLVRGDRAVNLTVASADAMNAATTLSARGTLRTGTVTLNSSSTPAINSTTNPTTAGFSLVGNPYQSAVDWHLVTKSGIEDTYYAWAPNMGSGAARGNYVAYNVSTGNSGGGAVGQFIQPGQAFFVKNTVSGTAGTLTFQEAHKATTNANVFRTANQTESTNFASLSMQLYDPNELAIGGYPIDATKAVFGAEYTNELGLGDATKLEAAGENIAWFRNNTKLAIDAAAPVTTSDELVLKTLRLGANKNYTFKIQTTNFDTTLTPYLVDTFLNTQTEIATSQAFLASFATTSNMTSYSENRFKIVFQNALLNTDAFAAQVGLYPNPSKGNGFYLQLPSTAQATVRLFNTLGQEIAISHNEGHYQAKQSLAAGVYHIMVTQGEKTSKLKWIVE